MTGSFLCIGHVPEDTSRPDDILKCIKPLITPHYFRHNHVTMLYEAGIDSLIAMKIVGHTDYQTTANIYTRIKKEMLKKATVSLKSPCLHPDDACMSFSQARI